MRTIVRVRPRHGIVFAMACAIVIVASNHTSAADGDLDPEWATVGLTTPRATACVGIGRHRGPASFDPIGSKGPFPIKKSCPTFDWSMTDEARGGPQTARPDQLTETRGR